MSFLGYMNASYVKEMIKNLSLEERLQLFQSVGLRDEADIQSFFSPEDEVQSIQSLDFLTHYEAYRIHKVLLLYIPPILLLFGTFGNVFSFLILRQKSMAKISTYFYLSMLSIADLLVLYFGLLRLWVGELTNFDIRDESDWLCKLVMFLGYVSSDLSVWLIIAVTVERYVVVSHPLKASRFCTVPKAKRVTLAVVAILIALHVHFLWSVSLSDENDTAPRCRQAKGFIYFVTVIWPVIDTLLYFVIPFVMIFTLNVYIIWQVRKAKSGRDVMQNDKITSSYSSKLGGKNNSLIETKRRGRSSKDSCTKITMMLLTISFTFVLTTLPMNICMIAARKWNQDDKNHARMAQVQLVKTVAELLMYLNHCVNFFLYCATGQKFRHQFLRLCCPRYNVGAPSENDHSKHLYCSRQGSSPFPFSQRQTSNDSDDPSPCLSETRV